MLESELMVHVLMQDWGYEILHEDSLAHQRLDTLRPKLLGCEMWNLLCRYDGMAVRGGVAGPACGRWLSYLGQRRVWPLCAVAKRRVAIQPP